MKILILGASGLVGNGLFRYLSTQSDLDIYGSIRSTSDLKFFYNSSHQKIFTSLDVLDIASLENSINFCNPNVVINCIGKTNKKIYNDNYLRINALLPHQLYYLSKQFNFRLIQISTDCVFSGAKGNYCENEFPDGDDDYGISKLLGEVTKENSLTIRTSFIGHELNTKNGLLEWFLTQNKGCTGFSNAIFSGFPTISFGEILKNYIFNRPELQGIYHIGSNPISKFDLLQLISEIYKKEIEIREDSALKIDRSLNSDKFNTLTGFKPESWESMIIKMNEFNILNN